MSADSYVGAMQSREDRLARCGLGPKPSVDELVELVIELSDKLDALYGAARRVPVKDERGNWRAAKRG